MISCVGTNRMLGGELQVYGLKRVECAIYRGGTSRGVFLHADDVPKDSEAQDQLALALMGSPDVRQIDGLGGATSHTSKVVIMSRSAHQEADVDYNFLQVAIDRSVVDHGGMCGNLLSAAGLFAVDEGLVKIQEPVTVVRIRNVNTDKFFRVHIPVNEGQSVVLGDYTIAGVAKAGAYIRNDFLDPGGSVTGKLLPTGNPCDEIEVDGTPFRISLVDASNPLAIAQLSDFGLNGDEPLQQLNSDSDLLTLFENVRAECAYHLGFVQDKGRAAVDSPALPRLCVVGSPIEYRTLSGTPVSRSQQDLTCRLVSMQKVHQSIAVTGAVCLGTAVLIEGTVPNRLMPSGAPGERLRIGHPSGVMEVEAAGRIEEGPQFRGYVSLGRTARRLMDGFAYVPE